MTDANVALQAQTAASAGLRANLVCRVIFAILGTLLCWVPFRLLLRNGEFAAVVFVVGVVITNLFTIVNSLLWRNDYWEFWYDGTGWCDLQVWLQGPLQTIYAASIFAIMRHLARQVGLMRVATLSAKEKRRRNLIQALIIFPIPLIQLAFAWFDLAQRYIIGTLVGCTATYDASWPKMFVYTVPPVLFAMGSVPYAFLTWKRYRAIAIASAAALISNSSAASRANRARRRLYQMSLSILVPYVPLMLAFFAYNIIDTGTFKTYNYHRIHYTPSPYPWNSVVLVPSWLVPFPAMNQPWISILTTIPIVLFFGMTKDAMDTYRKYALVIGLGKCWPALRDKGPKPGQGNVGSSNEYSFRIRTTTTSPSTVRRRSNSTHDFIMQDFAPNTVANTGRPPRNLPNRHHEAIVSASGQASVPPRASSVISPSARPPVIPARGSSKFHKVLEQFDSIAERLALIESMQNIGGGSKSGSENKPRNLSALQPEGGESSYTRQTPVSPRHPNSYATWNPTFEHRDLRGSEYSPYPDLTIPANKNNNNNHTGGRVYPHPSVLQALKEDNQDNNDSGGNSIQPPRSDLATPTENSNKNDDSHEDDPYHWPCRLPAELFEDDKADKSIKRSQSEPSSLSGREVKNKKRDARIGRTGSRTGTGRGLVGPGIGIGVGDDANDDASTPMLPMHSSLQPADSDPLSPVEEIPSPRLHVDSSELKSEPKSEDGVPVTPS